MTREKRSAQWRHVDQNLLEEAAHRRATELILRDLPEDPQPQDVAAAFFEKYSALLKALERENPKGTPGGTAGKARSSGCP